LKCTEAVTIQRTYNQIKSHLIQESLTYTNRLDAMEMQIRRTEEELREAQRSALEADLAQKNAKNELKKSEDRVYRERKERELRLNELKSEAEEKRLHAERVDRRALQRPTSPQEDLKDKLSENDQNKVDMYENAFSRIKEATGTSTMQEVVDRFMSQDSTTAHLETMKIDAQQNVAKLRDEKARLNKEFEEMKYSGEAKTST
jgi:coiled-coil domain-containing protein 151